MPVTRLDVSVVWGTRNNGRWIFHATVSGKGNVKCFSMDLKRIGLFFALRVVGLGASPSFPPNPLGNSFKQTMAHEQNTSSEAPKTPLLRLFKDETSSLEKETFRQFYPPSQKTAGLVVGLLFTLTSQKNICKNIFHMLKKPIQ
jgi:hypothetical protein